MDDGPLIERAKAFVKAVAAHAPWAEIEAYYAPGIMQEEFPNRLLPKGAIRNLDALREASAKGRQVISTQTVEIVRAISSNPCVALEAIWTGTLAVGVGELKSGDQLRFAQFCDFKDGLIWRQRNYDCFDPW